MDLVRRDRMPGMQKKAARLQVAPPQGVFPVPPPPKSLSKPERDVWIELGAGGVNPSRLATFRSLVTCTATMRRPGLKPSTLSALLRTAERLRVSIETAPVTPDRRARVSGDTLASEEADDPMDDILCPLPHFSDQNYFQDASGAWRPKSEAEAQARRGVEAPALKESPALGTLFP